MAVQQNDSLSHLINRLIQIGMQHLDEGPSSEPIEQHCQQLIIQMNALIKNMSVEILKFQQEDFERLKLASLRKYEEFR